MGLIDARAFLANTQAPPIVSELQAVFDELPDDELIEKLRGPKRRGPKGYDPTILWRCYIAYYFMGLKSVSDLIRTLQDNPFVAYACGIESPDNIPSQPTFSRFMTKLASQKFRTDVRNVMRKLTLSLYERFPDFGKSVAIDSTDIKAWSNGGKIRKRRSHIPGKRGPKPRRGVSDRDAGWIVKKNTEGNIKYVWGYKVHILADTQYELPIAADVTAGNVHDIKKATPLLQQARFTTSKFHPDYVICDAAYSDDRLRKTIRRQYSSLPIIDPNPAHKKAVAATNKTAEWKMAYNRRIAVERLNGRLKDHRKLNHLRVRGRFKVSIHAYLSMIVCQAHALATESLSQVRKVA